MPPKNADKTTQHSITLRRIRERAGLSQLDMAGKLGVRLGTYQSYEYVRTKKVPSRVMDAARKLSIDPEYSYVIAMYGGRPMRDIAKEWARRMGVSTTPTEIAEALGIHKSNVSRWLNPSGKSVDLTPEEFIAYERRVAREEAYYQKSLERHAAMA